VDRMRAVIAAEECRSDILGTPPLESDPGD
jgi:hypothetical protein